MIQRRTPIKRSPLKPSGKPIRKQSKKRQRESRIYTQKRKAYLEAHPWCEVWQNENLIVGTMPVSGTPLAVSLNDPLLLRTCPIATDIHHTKGRSGTNYLDESTWMAVCRENHERIHNNPKWARERGYLLT